MKRLFLFFVAASFAFGQTWVEDTSERTRTSRVYQDSESPTSFVVSAGLIPVHYETEPGSGIWANEVDLVPEYITAGGNDLWRVTDNSWHFALGQPVGEDDGWVGFGGRQGAHWFRFRLERVGYLHWPTRDWDDIGGLANYVRGNLSQQVVSRTIGPNSDEVFVSTAAIWSDLWTTPGDGSIDVQWLAQPSGLKEEILVNAAARNWIAANRPPTTPVAETWFGFVFRLDWSDIPKAVIGAVQQDLDGDWSDDGETVELTDSLDRLLAFMPASEVRAPSDQTAPLRKRFYVVGGVPYMLLGVRMDTLATLPAGDLIFDPTVEETVGASADDGDENISSASVDCDHGTSIRSNTGLAMLLRFPSLTIPGSATIDHAYVKVSPYNAGYDDPDVDIYAEDGASPAQCAESNGNITGRTYTTATVNWSADDIGTGELKSSPDINNVIQELEDTYDYSGGAPIAIILENDGDDDSHLYVRPVEFDSGSLAAELYIEYTAGGAPTIYKRFISVN